MTGGGVGGNAGKCISSEREMVGVDKLVVRMGAVRHVSVGHGQGYGK